MRAAFFRQTCEGRERTERVAGGFKMCLTKKMPPHIMGIKVQAILRG